MDSFFANKCYQQPIFFTNTADYIDCNLPRRMMFAIIVLIVICIIAVSQSIYVFAATFMLSIVVGIVSYYAISYFLTLEHQQVLTELKNRGYKEGDDVSLNNARVSLLQSQRNGFSTDTNFDLNGTINSVSNLLSNIKRK